MNYPNTHIHPDAKIGNNVTIDPFTVIHNDVEIGDGTWIGSSVTIFQGARIGKNCRIFPGAVISAVPQDLKFGGEITTAEIGDNTTIREFVTINKGTKANGKTVVGSNNLLMAYVHVAHDCIIGNNCILANGATLAGHIVIDDFAIIGGLSAIHQFVHIGSHVMISGGSLIKKDVPPYIKAAREPLAYMGLNSVGLRRRGFNNEKIAEIQNIYRIVFQQGNNRSQALQVIENELSVSAERDSIISFMKGSTRGLLRGNSTNGMDED
ncbi:MAG: acyl-ACP--UDP-N-acetylglucosamine O-acyltransferase [Bacteroidetes bacterium]|nr:acyl-ACP--UDP-N-acetylglucosamine O-acyltransferase [Bacteroidota bacterium]